MLHLTSTETGRKGTQELLGAWRSLLEHRQLPVTARLTVVASPLAVTRILWWRREFGLTDEQVQIEVGFSRSPSELAESMSGFHVVCQPSRGEGFGMVPLEALACGIPVVMTGCTGHSEYAEVALGAEIIETGALAPSDDFPGAQAPSLEPAAIGSALIAAFVTWKGLHERALLQAREWPREWAWTSPRIRHPLESLHHEYG